MTTSAETLKKLQKLSGMIVKWGVFTPEEWKQKTGVNPADSDLRPFIYISEISGVCVMRPAGAKIINACHARIASNFEVLGV